MFLKQLDQFMLQYYSFKAGKNSETTKMLRTLAIHVTSQIATRFRLWRQLVSYPFILLSMVRPNESYTLPYARDSYYFHHSSINQPPRYDPQMFHMSNKVEHWYHPTLVLAAQKQYNCSFHGNFPQSSLNKFRNNFEQMNITTVYIMV
jgi:hypothetical protein